MKNCPTANMNRSRLWGFEVSHIVASFLSLAVSNVVLNIMAAPLFLSWVLGGGVLIALKLLSIGQKDGHLEFALSFAAGPHIFLGHKKRGKDDKHITHKRSHKRELEAARSN